MISRIDLQHFKCFQTLKLPLRLLTLLAGGNASGKSTVLQALVLLHQTLREHEWSTRLMLNGATIRLGTCADVIDKVYGHHRCTIALFHQGGEWFGWEFEGESGEMSMAVRRVHGHTDGCGAWDLDRFETLRHLLPVDARNHSLTDRISRLSYLTAERLGPREFYRHDDPQLTPVVGPRGEYAASILHTGQDYPVLPELVNAGTPPTLFRQVEAWMACFFPGCVIAVNQVPRANAVTLGFRVSNDTDFHRPGHVGFGLTQVLPIVVAALSAKMDDLLLIENPEVHLHPAGQAEMGQFLATVAAAGVQVILETHSDHVLNGIRRAVKADVLSGEEVALHFFKPRGKQDGGESQVESPAIDSNGNIDLWPDGFFDQFDRDMNFFAGWG